MKVIKIGGGCLKDEKTIAHILDLIVKRGQGQTFVVSALNGVTDFLFQSIPEALEHEDKIPDIINRLQEEHVRVARHLVSDAEEFEQFCKQFKASVYALERLYYGLNFSKDLSLRTYDAIVCFGERFAVELLVYALHCRRVRARYLMPEDIGLMTDGKFGDATANIALTTRNFRKHVKPLLDNERIIFIPGFFGMSEKGDITTFGRGGSDYSAAVVAVALQAEELEIWKNVEGFMSADPEIIPEARLIPALSYEEAAELAYFGAKILHPRTVEPVRKSQLKIEIRNTLNPNAPGTVITGHSPIAKRVIKSVAYDPHIGILKVHSPGIGIRPGILSRIASQFMKNGLNIKSVETSQTCISLLLASKDMEAGYQALKSIRPRPYHRVEHLEDIALIGIVGEGLSNSKGVAARCFTAVAKSGVNVEMISFGPSRVAMYFLVRNQDLSNAVNAIHNTFFTSNE